MQSCVAQNLIIKETNRYTENHVQYVAHHKKKKIITTGKRAVSKRQPLIIDFQNKIVEMKVKMYVTVWVIIINLRKSWMIFGTAWEMSNYHQKSLEGFR